LPIAIVGASLAMPRGVSWPRRGRHPIAVVFGDPLRAAKGENAEEFSQRVEDVVRQLHDSMPLPGVTVAAQKGTR